MFVLQPVLFLSSFGTIWLYKQKKHFARLLLGTISLITLFAALNLSIDGGSMRDPRYVIPILPLFFLPLGFVLDQRVTRFSSLFHFLFAVLSCFGFVICALHFIDTASSVLDSYIQEAQSHQSLISKEGVYLLLKNFIPNPARGLIPFTISLATGCLLYQSIKKMLEHLDRRRLSSIPSSSFAMVLLIDLFLATATAYATVRPVNLFNLFPDTVRVGQTPAALAVQFSGLTREFGEKTFGAAVRAGNSECSGGILVSSPSITRFDIPTTAEQFQVEIGIAEGSRDSSPSDVTYEIRLDEKVAWSAAPVNRGNPRIKAALPLFEAKTIELRTNSGNRNPELLSVWCEPRFN
jgi:hypothetical protein